VGCPRNAADSAMKDIDNNMQFALNSFKTGSSKLK
jgi:hypothetical protein